MASLNHRFWALPEGFLLKLQFGSLSMCWEKRIQASSKEKPPPKVRRSTSSTLGASHFPGEGTVSERPAVCSLCGHTGQFPFASRGSTAKGFLTGLYRVASSPATSRAVHLKAACCMHSRSPSPVFLEPDTKCQERHLFWCIQLKGNSKLNLW